MVAGDKHGLLLLEFAHVAGETGQKGTRLRFFLLLYPRHGFVPNFHEDLEITHWCGALLSLNGYQDLE